MKMLVGESKYLVEELIRIEKIAFFWADSDERDYRTLR